MQQITINNPNCTTLVCVDSFEDSILTGRMYNPCFDHAVKFHGVMQFLFQMEELLNKIISSKDFENAQPSKLAASQEADSDAVKSAEKGNLETFSVQVLSRQNMSWQGRVCWMGGKQEKAFRSELELVLLMDSVLTQ